VGEWRGLEGCERGYALFSEMRKKRSCSEISMDQIWVQGINGDKYQSTGIQKLARRRKVQQMEINIRISEAYHLLKEEVK
jgi:hypothetical protein